MEVAGQLVPGHNRSFFEPSKPNEEQKKTHACRAPTRPTLAVPRFGSPLDRQLELVRAELRWLEVPVLRNRKINALVGMETPWDNFGPPPPPTMEEMYGADARRLDDPLQ